MNLEDLRKIALVLIGEKAWETKRMSPELFSEMLHSASLKHFKRKIGLPEEYRPGMPLPSQAFEITSKITEDMRPFKKMAGWEYSEPLKVNEEGYAEYPDDYFIVSAITYFYIKDNKIYERGVNILSDLEFTNANTSISEKPDLFFPACNLQSSFIQFSPKNVNKVNMLYLRLPKKPVYKTIKQNGFMYYDEENSINLEWDDVNKLDVLTIMLSDLGLAVNRQDVLAYAEKIKERGV